MPSSNEVHVSTSRTKHVNITAGPVGASFSSTDGILPYTVSMSFTGTDGSLFDISLNYEDVEYLALLVDELKEELHRA